MNWALTVPLRSALSRAGARWEWAVKHLPRSGRVEAPLPDGRTLVLWSRGDDWVSNQVFWRGWSGHEPETAPAFRALAAHAGVTLDVGAHVGFYALVAGHANPAGRVFAFEPLALACERLRRHVRLNGLANVECVPVAASDVDGAIAFHVPTGHPLPCSAGTSAAFHAPWADAMETTSVACVTVDAFARARALASVDLIKIDVEGGEPAVLRGAAAVLEQHRPDIVCEVLSATRAAEELAEILLPLGYRFYLLTADGPVRRRRLEPHPRWMNQLFTARPERAESILALDPVQP
ncbi:MAG: FkbM family methyltransferase [Vicinamibacteria bacterium]